MSTRIPLGIHHALHVLYPSPHVLLIIVTTQDDGARLHFYKLNFCSSKGFTNLFTMQGQCKPNAESLLYAEVQPVLALDFEGKDQKFWRNIKMKIPIMKG